MRVEIWKEFQFDAAHRLPFLPATHKCHALHGHTYAVRVTIAGELRGDWLLDFAQFKSMWEQVCGRHLDHKYLNEVDGLESPTAERIAVWIFQRMSVAVPHGVDVMAVDVRETPTSGATVRA